MALEVRNPFLMLDDFILDWVFNPFSWWSEYQYGKDAMSISLVVSLVGYALIALLLFNNQSYILTYIVLAFAGHEMTNAGLRRKIWLRNTRTGRNIARATRFGLRMVVICVMSYLIITDHQSMLRSNLYTCQLMIGSIMAILAPLYFDATDSLPHNYKERKRTRLLAGPV